MRQQHVVHDQAGAEYAGGLQSLWATWEPALRGVEGLFDHPDLLEDMGPDAPAHQALARAQYRAHTASELAVGLRPPLAAVDAHEYLVHALEHAREVLATLVLSSELHDLDEQTVELGARAVRATRDAFQAARSSSTAAIHFHESMRPIYVEAVPERQRGLGMLLWGLVVICVALFAVLLVQVLTVTGAA